MTLVRPPLFATLFMLAACPGNGGGSPDEGGTTGTTGSTTESDPTTSIGDSTSADSTTSAGDSTTLEPTSADSTSESSGDSGSTGDDTTGFDCASIPSGPFAAERILQDVPFQTFSEGGAEDLGFDGQGHLAARGQGDTYLLVSPDGSYDEFAMDSDPTYGLRFLANGNVVAAAYQANDILSVTPTGEVSTFAANLGGVNGLFPDFAGGVWYTNFSVVGYITDEGQTIQVVNPASGANGIVYDDARQTIFFTNYNTGALRKSQLVDGAAQTPVDIGSIDGAPDGITLDICGNLYINDQANSDMYRLFLDAEAMPVGEAELLIEDSFPTNVANAQFGSGDGWESTSLYAIGGGGGLYRIEVGVPGAAYVTVE